VAARALLYAALQSAHRPCLQPGLLVDGLLSRARGTRSGAPPTPVLEPEQELLQHLGAVSVLTASGRLDSCVHRLPVGLLARPGGASANPLIPAVELNSAGQ